MGVVTWQEKSGPDAVRISQTSPLPAVSVNVHPGQPAELGLVRHGSHTRDGGGPGGVPRGAGVAGERGVWVSNIEATTSTEFLLCLSDWRMRMPPSDLRIRHFRV